MITRTMAMLSVHPSRNKDLRITLRDGHYLFFYPMEGRLAHLGLATLFAAAPPAPKVARPVTLSMPSGRMVRLPIQDFMTERP